MSPDLRFGQALWKFSENTSKLMQKHSNQDMVEHGLLEILPGGALSPAGLDLVKMLAAH